MAWPEALHPARCLKRATQPQLKAAGRASILRMPGVGFGAAVGQSNTGRNVRVTRRLRAPSVFPRKWDRFPRSHSNEEGAQAEP
jgi:hypothetical protein